jgi:hypothetical protein
MREYILKNKQTVPDFIAVAVASWAIAVAAITALGFTLWGVSSWMHFDPLAGMPKLLLLLFGICGAYAGLGGICLWVTMCVYWIAVERSSVAVRIGWLLALLFRLHLATMFYASWIWKKGITKVEVSSS